MPHFQGFPQIHDLPETIKNFIPPGKAIPLEPQLSIAEEIAKLTERIDELVYWLRPMNGNLITGKAAVEEFERLKLKI